MHTQRIRRIRQSTMPSVEARVTSINLTTKKRADTSRQIEQEDVFGLTTFGKTTLVPPYDPAFLANCVERNNMLKQCIAAIVTNVGLSGFEVVPLHEGVPMNEDERDELQSFIDSANSEESLTTVHSKNVEDYEGYGYTYVEVIRDRKGRPTLWRHMKAIDTRLLPKDDDPQRVDFEIARGKRTAFVTEYRCFRRFAQIVNGKTRFFKEFGDQRKMNMDTGEFGPCPRDLEATEVLHFKQNSTESYGVPRWINQLPSILGSRESEECNLRYFEDNTIPPMILSVAGGRLTKQSYRDLKDILEKNGIGAERQHKLMLIEAVPERESLDERGATVTLKIDKLTDARQSDGLFKEYDEANQAKIRSSFRLPPVAVGLSQDVTFATANVSAFIAESQVYLPERNQFDEFYNKRFVNHEQGLNLKTVALKSRVTLASNPETIIKAATALNTMGAITPRMANKLGNSVLQVDLDPFPEKGEEGYEKWMDEPIVFVTRGTASQDGQAQKTAKQKELEKTGNIGLQSPEHGQE